MFINAYRGLQHFVCSFEVPNHRNWDVSILAVANHPSVDIDFPSDDSLAVMQNQYAISQSDSEKNPYFGITLRK